MCCVDMSSFICFRLKSKTTIRNDEIHTPKVEVQVELPVGGENKGLILKTAGSKGKERQLERLMKLIDQWWIRNHAGQFRAKFFSNNGISLGSDFGEVESEGYSRK